VLLLQLAYLIVTISVLVWTYRKHSDEYLELRTMLGVITALALIGFWMFPAAPPRLLTNAGFVDTLTRHRAVGWWGSADSLPSGAKSIGNQFAAMPSLHVAWALWCAWVVQRRASRRWAKFTIWSYPAITTLVVLATANH
jgi:PAP2 superfamily